MVGRLGEKTLEVLECGGKTFEPVVERRAFEDFVNRARFEHQDAVERGECARPVGPAQVDSFQVAQHPRQDVARADCLEHRGLHLNRLAVDFGEAGANLVQVENGPAVERVDDEFAAIVGRLDQEMVRKGDTEEVQAKAAADFDIDQRKCDGKAEAAFEHVVQKGVARVAEILAIAGEAFALEQELGEELNAFDRVGAAAYNRLSCDNHREFAPRVVVHFGYPSIAYSLTDSLSGPSAQGIIRPTSTQRIIVAGVNSTNYRRERAFDFVPDSKVGFALTNLVEGAARMRSAETAERPCGVRTDERLRLFRQRAREHGNRGGISAVAEHDRGVAQEPAALGALDRGFTEAAPKALVVERHQFGQRGHQLVAWRSRGRRVVVPRTDLLTDVASEDPVAELGAQLGGDWSAMFDRQVGDAYARLDHVAVGERIGGAEVEASAARPAMLAIWFGGHREFDVGENFAEKEV